MGFRTKISNVDGDGCCPCNQTRGCDCEVVPCALSCDKKESTATLCGFDEYTDPSSPPKKYRRKTTSGTLRRCTYPFDADCSPTPGSAVDFFGSGAAGSCCAGTDCATGSASARPTSVNAGAGTVTYTCTAATLTHSVFNLGCGGSDSVAVNIVSADSLDNHTIGLGGTAVLSRSPTKNPYRFAAVIHFSFGPYVGITGSEVYIDMRDVLATSLEDVWDRVDQYNESTCLLTQDEDSVRQTGIGDACPANAMNPDGEVNLDTFDGHLDETLAKETRVLDADATCSGGVIYEGSRTEELSDEDTEDDAEARANADIETWSTSTLGCAEEGAFRTLRGAGEFTFGYRAMKVRASIGTFEDPVEIGATYVVKIKFYRRVLVTGGPFIFFSVAEIEIVPDAAPTDITDWVDIPNEAGWETRALGCDVKKTADAPPP
jgi:hypothetical protein